MIKIGINGFNEIGKILVRMAAQQSNDIRIVKINQQEAEKACMAYSLRYSSIYGRFPGRIDETNNGLIVGNNEIEITDKECPSETDWSGCDVVIECNKKGDRRKSFFEGGTRRLLISGACTEVPLADYGANHKLYKGEKILSQACADTSAIAMLAWIMNKSFGIENGIAVTAVALDEKSLCVDKTDGCMWRSGRAADSVIPAVCGGAQGAGIIFPELKGLLSGIALRIPVKAVSALNLVCQLKEKTDYNELSSQLKKAAENELRGVIGVTDESVVSCDFIGCPLSIVVDLRAGLLQGGNLAKLTAWYDGVWSHANKLIKLAEFMCTD